MNILSVIWLIFFALDFFADWLLNVLNIGASLKVRTEDEEELKSIRYTLRKGHFALLRTVEGRILMILVFLTGAAGALDLLMMSWGLPVFWHGAVFLMIAAAVSHLAGLPSSLYFHFIIEEEFGFNTQSIKTFFSDQVRQLPVAAVLMLALLAGLYGILAWGGSWAWLMAWGFFTLFQLLMVVLFPVLIAPLFNRFEPLPEGSLRDRLSALAERCDFPNQGIFVMDGSRRSRHANAYFTGLGRFRRIVIFDTLAGTMSDEEVEAVLAHEIGHWKHGHIRKRLAVMIVFSLLLFALAGLIFDWMPLYAAFGFQSPSLHALLLILSFFSEPVTSFFRPLFSLRSRRHEYQADRFAVRHTGTAMISALQVLGKENLSNRHPHPAYSFWYYTHPTITERIAALEDTESALS